MTPLYIFDLDGTLALIQHRRHFVERKACPSCGWLKPCDHSRDGTRPKDRPRWKEFHEACVYDEPNGPVLRVLAALSMARPMNDIWVFSGRSDVVRGQTERWLFANVGWVPPLTMRKEGDFTPDDRLKESWLHAMPSQDRQRLIAVFDDRQRVVDMWRRNGVACLQVAAGDF